MTTTTQVGNVYAEVAASPGTTSKASQVNNVYAEVAATPGTASGSQVVNVYVEVTGAPGGAQSQVNAMYAEITTNAIKQSQVANMYAEVTASWKAPGQPPHGFRCSVMM